MGEVQGEMKVIAPTVPAKYQPGEGDDIDVFLLDVAFGIDAERLRHLPHVDPRLGCSYRSALADPPDALPRLLANAGRKAAAAG